MTYTVAVDFDATIAEYEHGQFSWSDVGQPIPGAIAFIKALKELGFNVVIFSARAKDAGGKRAIEGWVDKHASGLVSLVTSQKLPEFDVMVDDRAIHFDNNYKEVLKEILRRAGGK